MKKIHKTVLEAKVSARNTLNSYALEMIPKMVEALRPFIGKKVLNQGNILSQKVKDCLPESGWEKLDDGSTTRHFWYSASRYSITVHFKVSETSKGYREGDFYANYQENSFTLGQIDQGVNLKDVTQEIVLRTNFTIEEVQQARKDCEAARGVLREAEHRLCYFGEHDN